MAHLYNSLCSYMSFAYFFPKCFKLQNEHFSCRFSWPVIFLSDVKDSSLIIYCASFLHFYLDNFCLVSAAFGSSDMYFWIWGLYISPKVSKNGSTPDFLKGLRSDQQQLVFFVKIAPTQEKSNTISGQGFWKPHEWAFLYAAEYNFMWSYQLLNSNSPTRESRELLCI